MAIFACPCLIILKAQIFLSSSLSTVSFLLIKESSLSLSGNTAKSISEASALYMTLFSPISSQLPLLQACNQCQISAQPTWGLQSLLQGESDKNYSISVLVTFGAGYFFVVEAVLCIVGVQQHPWPLLIRCQQNSLSNDNQKCFQTVPNVPWASKSPHENH